MPRTTPVTCLAAVGLALVLLAGGHPRAQVSQPLASPFDEVLDTYVRDGWVYYRALKQDRSKLDAVVASLAGASVTAEPRDRQMAFWLNAYNALVLRTVVDA